MVNYENSKLNLKRIELLFGVLTTINIKKNNILTLDKQLDLSKVDVSTVNYEISGLNTIEYIEFLNSVLSNIEKNIGNENFHNLSILFGKAIYLFIGNSEVFYVYYKYLNLLQENTEFKNIIEYHKNKIVEVYLRYSELLSDENNKKNYLFFMNEKLYILNINILCDENKDLFFKKYYLRKMYNFETSCCNYDALSGDSMTIIYKFMNSNDDIDISFINKLVIPVKVIIVTMLLYDITRFILYSTQKIENSFLENLIMLSERFLLSTMSLVHDINPLSFSRHSSLIDAINTISIKYNLSNSTKKEQISVYLDEVKFLIMNNLHLISILKLQKIIEQLLKIKNLDNFFKLGIDSNMELYNMYSKLMYEYKLCLLIFHSNPESTGYNELLWHSDPFLGAALFIDNFNRNSDEYVYFKESIKFLNNVWNSHNLVYDNCFNINYI